MMSKREEYGMEEKKIKPVDPHGNFTISTMSQKILGQGGYFYDQPLGSHFQLQESSKNEKRLSQLVCILASALILSITVSAIFVTLFLAGVATLQCDERETSSQNSFPFLNTNNLNQTGQAFPINGVINGPNQAVQQGRSASAARTATDLRYRTLAQLSDQAYLSEVLRNIMIVRPVNSNGHAKVKNYIITQMEAAGWTVTKDSFTETTPRNAWWTTRKPFTNIIATLNPSAPRKLILACHYDSKVMRGNFVAATDSAAPCAILLTMAKYLTPEMMNEQINITPEVTLQMIFFDGEEAFYRWGPNDSLYGSRHLARLWKGQTSPNDPSMTTMDSIELFVLLDLLGQAQRMNIQDYFLATTSQYQKMKSIEQRLSQLGLLLDRCGGGNQYFKASSVTTVGIEDDHIPFLEENVKVLHLIPYPFPTVWHTLNDNNNALDINTVDNFVKIMNVFVADYLNIAVS